MAYTRKTWADDAGGGTPITAAELNRLESGVPLDRRWVAPSGATSIDEFTSGTIGGGWTRVDKSGNAGRVTWTAGADNLSVLDTGQDSSGEFHALMTPLSGFGGSVATGDAFTTYTTVLSYGATANSCAAVVLADGITSGSGTQIMALNYQTAGNSYTCGIFPQTGYQTTGSYSQNAHICTQGVHLRLVCTGANTWRADISPDGTTWVGTASMTQTVTPTYVGLGVSTYGSATKFVATFEYLRRYAGVS